MSLVSQAARRGKSDTTTRDGSFQGELNQKYIRWGGHFAADPEQITTPM